MSDLDEELGRDLVSIRAQGLERHLCRIDSPQRPLLVVSGRNFLNFSSNDYLGLADHPVVKTGALNALEKHGAGSGASRLISGSLQIHDELERALAAFKSTEAALTFSSGYMTALGTIGALVGKGDFMLIDRLAHACIIDGARLSGATLRVFAHNSLDDLAKKLAWAAAQRQSLTTPAFRARPPRILIATESVFSMDGDLVPLPGIVELKDRFGAYLMLDEAHATGLCGRAGRGLADDYGLGARIEVQMGTLGKALGSAGGYICGSQCLVDFLINRARNFIFSTAPVPAAAGAALAALELVQSAEGEARRQQLFSRVAQLRAGLGQALIPLGQSRLSVEPHDHATTSAILPVIVGKETEAMRLSRELRERGFFVPSVRYPSVARGQARLRITLTAAHHEQDIARLIGALHECGVCLGGPGG
jgi:8-amino-7-oxononanoate synthase